jgi:hypothetical protein
MSYSTGSPEHTLNLPLSRLDLELNFLSQVCPGTTLSNMFIRELVVFSPVPGPVPITSLDAIAIGFSQNAFPGPRVQ